MMKIPDDIYDPCPCQSGKKYKFCCYKKGPGSAPQVDFTYRRYRQLEAALIPELMECAVHTWGKSAIFEAWDEFHLWKYEEDFSPDSLFNQVFMPYFLFYWTPDLDNTECDTKGFEGKTVVEIFLSKRQSTISPEQIEILNSANRRPLNLYEILNVVPEAGYRVRDLFTEEEYEITEQMGSRDVRRGNIVLCAIFNIAGRWQNMATAPCQLSPIEKQPILNLREQIKSHLSVSKLTDSHLVEFGDDIRELYLNLARALLNPQKPILTNTDGDLLVPQKLYFEVNSAKVAFDGLKTLARKVMSDKELLRDAIFESEILEKVEIPWFKTGKNSNEEAGYTVLGRVAIHGKKLVVSVNSDNRANKIRIKIERILGENVRYVRSVIESIEKQFSEMNTVSADPAQEVIGEEMPPEVQAQIKKMADAHWKKWLIEPIPVLNGLSPRNASKTKIGRDLLESLLLYYEQQDARSSKNIYSPNIEELREKLGIKRKG